MSVSKLRYKRTILPLKEWRAPVSGCGLAHQPVIWDMHTAEHYLCKNTLATMFTTVPWRRCCQISWVSNQISQLCLSLQPSHEPSVISVFMISSVLVNWQTFWKQLKSSAPQNSFCLPCPISWEGSFPIYKLWEYC